MREQTNICKNIDIYYFCIIVIKHISICIYQHINVFSITISIYMINYFTFKILLLLMLKSIKIELNTKYKSYFIYIFFIYLCVLILYKLSYYFIFFSICSCSPLESLNDFSPPHFCLPALPLMHMLYFQRHVFIFINAGQKGR
jgi:hypothetical protein